MLTIGAGKGLLRELVPHVLEGSEQKLQNLQDSPKLIRDFSVKLDSTRCQEKPALN